MKVAGSRPAGEKARKSPTLGSSSIVRPDFSTEATTLEKTCRLIGFGNQLLERKTCTPDIGIVNLFGSKVLKCAVIENLLASIG